MLTVIGVEEKSYNIKAGHKINSSKLKAAKEVFELFNRTSVSKKLPLASINVSRTRCISAILSNGTELILDESSLENSLDGLHKIFSELRKNRIKPTYIDLRFKEPIIGTG